MTYRAALAYIASMAPRGWRLGLDRMQELARRAGLSDALGDGGRSPRFIHVAGTNGKGSVTAFVQSILTEAGYRTGGYFSPYVYDPRERIQMGCEMIPKRKLAAITESLMPVAESLARTKYGEVTEFEFKTAVGFRYWKDMACELVALEVGLGGRLDSTNIVTPAVSVITSISMDHKSILGDTLAEIAYEKAGIIKRGAPVVVGNVPAEALRVIAKVARELGAPLISISTGPEPCPKGWRVVSNSRSIEGLVPPFPGAHMAENMALAIQAIDAAGIVADQNAIRNGVAKTKLPGRFERRTWDGMEAILDGAHNEASAAALVETFRAQYQGRRPILLSGMVGGHDARSFYRSLAGLARRAHFVPVPSPRSRQPEDLASEAGDLFDATTSHESVRAGLAMARRDAEDGLILVAGSFYLLEGVSRCLKSCSEHRPPHP